ncbi:hypothetical protein KIS1582_1301 [Cytobacillus firmus]|uniref:Uncharacterized protein n=1 Tax=Cytobacillus firmus TaxID=1399 RepID=A0A800MYN9_CYTFI|nr:hypothetical protein KIS1582_1301 [Cytobacillus firmus]
MVIGIFFGVGTVIGTFEGIVSEVASGSDSNFPNPGVSV